MEILKWVLDNWLCVWFITACYHFLYSSVNQSACMVVVLRSVKTFLVNSLIQIPLSTSILSRIIDLHINSVIFVQKCINCTCRSSKSIYSALDRRSQSPEFEPRHRHIWRVFHLWLRLITFGGRSAHLAYSVHKSGRKTSIIIIIKLKSFLKTLSCSLMLFRTWGPSQNVDSNQKIHVRRTKD